MAHNLTVRANGLVEMAYAGESPWHQLGYYLGENRVTSQVMMDKAGLDWTVEVRDLYTAQLADSGVSYVPVGSHLATVRADSQEVLGVVSKDYKPIQQRQAFDFMDALCGEAAAMYETAGSLGAGRKVWALVKLPQETVVVGDDLVRQYLLLTNAHDGTAAFTCGFTPIRVVCENTLTAAIVSWEKSVVNKVVVRHVGAVDVRVEEARRILGMSLRYFEVAGASYRAMSAVQCSDLMLQDYFRAVLPLPEVPAADQATDLRRAQADLDLQKARQTHVTLAHLYDGAASGGSLPGVKGTLWGAYNAVTEWVDHVRPATKAGIFRKGGAEAALFGNEATSIKQRAYDAAVALLPR